MTAVFLSEPIVSPDPSLYLPPVSMARRAGPRKPARKPTMRKAKAMVSKQHKKMAKRNMDTFALTCRASGTITPSQGVTVSNYVSWWVPLLSTATNVSVSNIAEFNLYRTMYDRVRINSVRINVVPKANVLDQRQAQNDALVNASGDGLIHTVVDRDDQPPGSISRLMRYPSYKRFSVLRKFSRSYSVTYPKGIWLDCQDIYSDTTLLSRLGLTGGIYAYGESFLEDNGEVINEPWATVELVYNCVFEGKTSANLTYDPVSGVVSVAPTGPSQILADSPVTVLYGTINSDVKPVDGAGTTVPTTDASTP